MKCNWIILAGGIGSRLNPATLPGQDHQNLLNSSHL
jgi:dTDP-glucose pyrophosphorylase